MTDALVALAPPISPLLLVEGLTVKVAGNAGEHTLVNAIAFSLGIERVGLVGESGSGKSLTARALLGLLKEPLQVSASRLEYCGRDLRTLSQRQWSDIRGSQIALVLQDPKHALNPVLTVGRQIDEAWRVARVPRSAGRREHIAGLLEAVGIGEPLSVMRKYPHQLSGGMGQRVMIALALINNPRLLIADEPTSALDAEVREQVLALLTEQTRVRGMGLLLISHDLHQVATYCERALVMYRGRLVDICKAGDLAVAEHPYTRTLWACRPDGRTYGTMLPVLDRSRMFSGESR